MPATRKSTGATYTTLPIQKRMNWTRKLPTGPELPGAYSPRARRIASRHIPMAARSEKRRPDGGDAARRAEPGRLLSRRVREVMGALSMEYSPLRPAVHQADGGSGIKADSNSRRSASQEAG